MDLQKEIARIEMAIATTESNFLKKDYKKYLKKLKIKQRKASLKNVRC